MSRSWRSSVGRPSLPPGDDIGLTAQNLGIAVLLIKACSDDGHRRTQH
jgi:hypothetical protein